MKRIEITLGNCNYDVHLKEFGASFFLTGSVYCEIIPSVNVAKAALAKASEMSEKDKQQFSDALGAIAAIVCPCGDWRDIAKIKKEYGLL